MGKYEELKKEFERVEKQIKEEENRLAEKGVSFEEMISQTREKRVKLFSLSKEMRLLQEPTIQMKKKWKGELIELSKFSSLAKDGELTDEEGYGVYATPNAVSDIKIYPSDVLAEKIRTDFTHVMWFTYLKD